MKKYFLTTVAALMTAMSVSAQARFEKGTFTIQPRIGGTGSQYSNAPDLYDNGQAIKPTATSGSFFGVELEYYANERVGVAAGLGYSEGGSGWEVYNFYNSGVNMTVKERAEKTQYINLPVTVNWYIQKGLALKAGIQLGYLTSAKDYSYTEYSTGGVDYKLTAERKNRNELNKFDICLPIGISYEFKLPIVLDFRYNIGLTKVNKHETINGKDYKNLQAVFTIGYKIKK